MTRFTSERPRLRWASWFLRRGLKALPVPVQPWGEALVAEVKAVPQPQRWRFAIGAAAAIVAMLARHHVSTTWADRNWLVASCGAGLVIATVDALSTTRTSLRFFLPLACCVVGWLRFQGAWRFGMLLGLGVPLVAAIHPTGPYRYDVGDVWFGLSPAVMMASLAGWITGRCRRA